MSLPWFRYYSEALRDRKLEHACRAAGQPKHVMIALWTTLLCLANESPDRGALLITDDVPVTVDDIADETEIPLDTVRAMLDALDDLGRIERRADVISISNWDKRQFASDNSTARVRRWRHKRRDATFQQRCGNGPDTDTDSDTDTDTEAPAQTKQQILITEQRSENGLWRAVQAELAGQMPRETYESWLASAMLLSTDEPVRLGLRTEYAREWCATRLNRTIRNTLARHLKRPELTVQYEVVT